MIKYSTNYNPILEYWEDIEAGEVVSQKVRKVYKKLVNDLNNKELEWEYSSRHANHAIEFIENFLKHSKGQVKPFILEKWQKALIGAAFGFIHKETGLRKYRELILIVARKNGKSSLGSAIGLYMLMADGEAGPSVVSAATKRDQAKIIWEESKKMIKKSPALNKMAKCKVGTITTEFNEGNFTPLSSESNSLDGLNVHCSLIDELHAIQDKNLYDVIIDGMSARKQPLSVITSTNGFIRENIFDTKYEECRLIIEGYEDPNGYKDERVLPIIYELDSREEWTKKECWKKANPGLETIKDLDQLEAKVNKAIANPLLVKNLLVKDFNIAETSSEAWLTFEQLNNTATFDIKELKPRYGIAGIDLSETTDLTCATLLFRVPGREEIFIEQMYWLPEDLLEKRAKEDKIPYDIWNNLDLLRTTPGNRIDYKYITEWFLEMQNKHDIFIFSGGYDSWSASYLVQELKDIFGADTWEAVRQGTQTLSSPMKNLAADLEKKLINYNNNPILKWCLTNTAAKEDVNGNIQPVKTSNQRRRIDGLASLLDAYVQYERVRETYLTLI